MKLESQRNTSKPQHAYYTKEVNSLSPNMKRYRKIFIISHILMTFMFDLAVVLLGEVTYRSVLGLRGLKLFHAFCS